nr:hypothetical protein [Tanacetum cinerariifolium]
MTSLADKVILSGADNRPPMLEKDMYDSWKSQMELYMLNRQHGRMILESVESAVHPQSEFSPPENGLVGPVFQKGDDPIDAINHMMSFLTLVVTSMYPSTNNQLKTSLNPRQQATINNGRVTIQPLQGRQNSMTAGSSRPYTSGSSGTLGKQRVIVCYNFQAQANGQVLQEEELEFLADPGITETSKETLMLAEESHSKMIQKQNEPIMSEEKAELSAEQAFWSRYSVQSEEPNLSSSTTIVEVPKELPKVSMRNNIISQQSAPTFDQLFEINDLKAQSQENDTVIVKMKERLKSLSGNVQDGKIKRGLEEMETINIELDHRVTKLVAENENLKQTYKQLYDSIKSSRVRSKEQCDDLIKQVNIKSAENSDLNASLQDKVLVIEAFKETLSRPKEKNVVNEAVSLHSINPELLKIDVAPLAPKLRNNKTAHTNYLRHTQEETTTLREIVESKRLLNPLNTSLDYACNESQPQGNTKNARIQRAPSKAKQNKLEDHHRTVRPILNKKKSVVDTKAILFVTNSKLNVNADLKCATYSGCSKHMTGDRSLLINFVQKFHDLEVAFRQHTCFIRNLDGVDLLTGSRGNNLYTLSLQDMMASSPICLLSKASKTKSWLWHRRLSHLNFGAINHLARQGLVRGLPKLKFEKDHLCSARAMGKSMKKLHKPKSKDTNQEKLYLLHMDLYGPMRVESVNGKKYILVPVHHIRTDNGTEFVNQTLHEYYDEIGISHETSVALSPHQNGVIEREAVATACLTQNRSIVRLRHRKTPYELLHNKLPDLSYLHVFGVLCYPTNDSENLGKLQPKADIGIFIGYAPTKKAFRIYNRRTRRIVETIHVDLMASE